jgi:hypothetical protein
MFLEENGIFKKIVPFFNFFRIIIKEDGFHVISNLRMVLKD